jgi:rhodanese-related sulfurtransferase
MNKLKLVYSMFMELFFSITVAASSSYAFKIQQSSQTKKEEQKPSKPVKKMKDIIVDVRTPAEWQDGHADCSVNIPLNELASKIEELKGYEKVTLVCRSGARASSAKSMLEGAGIRNVENLGPWQNVVCK